MFSFEVPFAAIGRTYGLSPHDIDRIWDVVRKQPHALYPSDVLEQFETAAAELRIPLPTGSAFPFPVGPPAFDAAAEQERMKALRDNIDRLKS